MTRYAYDAQGKILTTTNAGGIVSARNQIGTGGDGAGRVVRQEQADGGAWEFEYLSVIPGCGGKEGSGVGGPCYLIPIRIGTRVTDPRGHSTVYLLTPEGVT